MHKAVVAHANANPVREHRAQRHVLEIAAAAESHGDRKGTGHARQGSTRSPQWTGGGVVFAPDQEIIHFQNKQEKKEELSD